MNQSKEFRKIELYCSLTITFLIVGLLTKREIVIVGEERITKTIGIVLLIGAFITMSFLAKELKKIDIHGVQGIATGSIVIYGIISYYNGGAHLWSQIIDIIEMLVYVFLTTSSFFYFIYSIFNKLKETSSEKGLVAIGIVFPAFTSVIAIIISAVDLLAR